MSNAKSKTTRSSPAFSTKAETRAFKATKKMLATTKCDSTLKQSVMPKAETHRNCTATDTANFERATVRILQWSAFDELCKAGTEPLWQSTTETVSDDLPCGFVAM